MNKHKYFKNDQPKKRERYLRLFYRDVEDTTNILSGTWLPATKTRRRTQSKEISKELRKYNEED